MSMPSKNIEKTQELLRVARGEAEARSVTVSELLGSVAETWGSGRNGSMAQVTLDVLGQLLS